jgi:hypothetical protein
MRTRLKIAWFVLFRRKASKGIMFMFMSEKMQKELIEEGKDIEFDIHYIGVDERVVKLIQHNIVD